MSDAGYYQSESQSWIPKGSLRERETLLPFASNDWRKLLYIVKGLYFIFCMLSPLITLCGFMWQKFLFHFAFILQPLFIPYKYTLCVSVPLIFICVNDCSDWLIHSQENEAHIIQKRVWHSSAWPVYSGYLSLLPNCSQTVAFDPVIKARGCI